MQDLGILQKLLDDGYYKAFGRSMQLQINLKESTSRGWTPITNQRLFPAYVGLSICLILTILAAFTEVFYVKCSAKF